MRNPRNIIALLVIVFVCWMVFAHRHKPAADNGQAEPLASPELTNAASVNPLPRHVGGSNRIAAVRPAQPLTGQSNSNQFFDTMTPEWQAAIDFYGKVVDENSNAVSGAVIQFSWSETPKEVLEESPGETSSTKSGADGRFELHGVHGPGLDVRVGKQGYYTSQRDTWSFAYAISGHFSPDPWNPVVFHLRKKGTPEPLLKLGGAMGGPRQYRLDTKGTATQLSFYTGKRSLQATAQFSVAYWMDATQGRNQRPFNWRCQVTVPGGGLQVNNDEYPFAAPEQGYQATIEIDSNTNAWSDRFQQSFYVHLPDGKFGRVQLSLVCSSNPFFGVEALINPSGSNNLEYDKYLPGNIMVDQSAP